MTLQSSRRVGYLKALVLALVQFPLAAGAQLLVVGNDEKTGWDEAGKLVYSPPGKDTVSIVDISNREVPRIVANLPLTNTVFGPPVNLAIAPNERLALVANSLNWVQDGASWKTVPDTKAYVIDLQASPPQLIASVDVGKQPSGLSINARGNLALVA